MRMLKRGKIAFPLRLLGFFLGLGLFVILNCLPTPSGMSPTALKMMSIVILMATWWITEAVPISVTSIIPLVTYPFLGIMSAKAAAAPYANESIYLFLGGFILAVAMQRVGLHRRIALTILGKGTSSPRVIILGFMVTSAALSMWVSNTATTMMLLPIALAVLDKTYPTSEISGSDQRAGHNFAVALLLGIAYSASIGGAATLVGTPPNIIFAGVFRNLFPQGPEISFVRWLLLGIPFTMLFLPIIWVMLTFVLCPIKRDSFNLSTSSIREEKLALGSVSTAEKAVLSVFFLTALLWIFRSDIELGIVKIPGWSSLFPHPEFIRDSTVAILSALLLFILPFKGNGNKRILDRTWFRDIPWNIFLLFGGGFALAEGFQVTGLSDWLGSKLMLFSHAPVWLVIVGIAFLVTFLTEVTSNTATTTVLLPILASASIAMQVNPLLLMVPATFSASCAFMLPVATPPNAIVFGGGYLTIPKMARTGLVLNFIGILLVSLIGYFLVSYVFGFSSVGTPTWAG